MIEVNGAPGTLYANESYQLQVDFPENYPMEAPQVCIIDPILSDALCLFVCRENCGKWKRKELWSVITCAICFPSQIVASGSVNWRFLIF